MRIDLNEIEYNFTFNKEEFLLIRKAMAISLGIINSECLSPK
jgi:hypothetical protein